MYSACKLVVVVLGKLQVFWYYIVLPGSRLVVYVDSVYRSIVGFGTTHCCYESLATAASHREDVEHDGRRRPPTGLSGFVDLIIPLLVTIKEFLCRSVDIL